MLVRELAASCGVTPEAVIERGRELGVDLVWSGAPVPEDARTRLQDSLRTSPPADGLLPESAVAPAGSAAPGASGPTYADLAREAVHRPASPGSAVVAAPVGSAGTGPLQVGGPVPGFARSAAPVAPYGQPGPYGQGSFAPPAPARVPTVAGTRVASGSSGCQICRRGPATNVSFEYGIGMFFLHQTRKRAGRMCRDCGKQTFWSFQGKTLVLGWWGLISMLVYNWIHIFKNLSNYLRVRKLPAPQPFGAPIPPR